jgi:hypothetical protein
MDIQNNVLLLAIFVTILGIAQSVLTGIIWIMEFVKFVMIIAMLVIDLDAPLLNPDIISVSALIHIETSLFFVSHLAQPALEKENMIA